MLCTSNLRRRRPAAVASPARERGAGRGVDGGGGASGGLRLMTCWRMGARRKRCTGSAPKALCSRRLRVCTERLWPVSENVTKYLHTFCSNKRLPAGGVPVNQPTHEVTKPPSHLQCSFACEDDNQTPSTVREASLEERDTHTTSSTLHSLLRFIEPLCVQRTLFYISDRFPQRLPGLCSQMGARGPENRTQ